MRLYVNIDHVATLREARKTDEPDPVRAADAAERAGADGITCRVKPFQATLVPERRQEITTEGGLALHGPGRHGPGRRGPNRHDPNRKVGAAVRRLMDAGIRVSLFIDPDLATIDRAAELGVPAIELHTGRYAHTWRKGEAALRVLRRAAAHAKARGLAVHAGHGLTYQNVQPVAAIAEIEVLNIGHSIVSNAVFWGMEEAVRRMRKLVDEAPPLTAES